MVLWHLNASAKPSDRCGAGREFLAVDRVSEPTVTGISCSMLWLVCRGVGKLVGMPDLCTTLRGDNDTTDQ